MGNVREAWGIAANTPHKGPGAGLGNAAVAPQELSASQRIRPSQVVHAFDTTLQEAETGGAL